MALESIQNRVEKLERLKLFKAHPRFIDLYIYILEDYDERYVPDFLKKPDGKVSKADLNRMTAELVIVLAREILDTMED